MDGRRVVRVPALAVPERRAPGGVPPLRDVPNSPNHLASLKAAAPIVGSLSNAMTRLSFVGPRLDKYDQSTDPPQGTTPSAVVWDVVLSGQAERYGLRYALGLYNAMDYRYTVPVSREFLQESIVAERPDVATERAGYVLTTTGSAVGIVSVRPVVLAPATERS